MAAVDHGSWIMDHVSGGDSSDTSVSGALRERRLGSRPGNVHPCAQDLADGLWAVAIG